jgi:hypothetical protein
MMRLYWRGLPTCAGGNAPGGIEASDLASQAVADTIEGRRHWQPQGDFFQFLKSVVDSKVNNLAVCLENKTTRRLGLGENKDAPKSSEVHDCEVIDPSQIAADQESAKRLRALILAEIGNDPMAEKVFECLDASIEKSADMAELLGIDIQEVYKVQKRLRSKAKKALQKHRKGSR